MTTVYRLPRNRNVPMTPEEALARARARFVGKRHGSLTVIGVDAARRVSTEHKLSSWLYTIRGMCDCGGLAVREVAYLGKSACCDQCRHAPVERDLEYYASLAERRAMLREAGERQPDLWREHGCLSMCERRMTAVFHRQKPSVVACARCAQVREEAFAELVELLAPMTLEEIGALFGFSRERIRQVEAGALKRLRRVHGLELEDAAADRGEHLWDRIAREGSND